VGEWVQHLIHYILRLDSVVRHRCDCGKMLSFIYRTKIEVIIILHSFFDRLIIGEMALLYSENRIFAHKNDINTEWTEVKCNYIIRGVLFVRVLDIVTILYDLINRSKCPQTLCSHFKITRLVKEPQSLP
jgi:hypothetical protein